MRLALTIALVLAAVPALADVVELKTGQRVEGTLKQADQATVTIEVGGQAIIFKAEQVRAMYYGSTPATAPVAEPASEALRALKALHETRRGPPRPHPHRLPVDVRCHDQSVYPFSDIDGGPCRK